MEKKAKPFSHIDLRVTSWEKALPFYEKLLPALGFTRRFDSSDWKAFVAEGDLPDASYFAIAEDPDHTPNKNLIGFWAHDQQEVDYIAKLVREAGGKITAGPGLFPISPTYYSVYFEDPCGNAYEFLHRTN
ncbi:VOC family protein [Larkinella bovis]|uniref:VOC family protein n=1 Tax=Larkinella bovis TaxID=683041 RepID=A0ABW0IBS8_9BACT